MINGYTIRNVNGEDVLYLFFDFNYEFSSFDFMAKREKIHDVVKNFIHDHNILFKGMTIALVSGGVLFGSINLNNPSFSQVSIPSNVSVVERVSNGSDSSVKVVDSDVVDLTDDNDKLSNNDILYDDSSSIVSSNSNVTESNSSNVTQSISNNVSESISDSVSEDSSSSDVIDSHVNDVSDSFSEVSEPEVIDNSIYVSVRRNSGVVRLELEDYVTGVVGAEMPALFNVEALKAQAIIARTYALKANSTGRILSDNESTQSYKDNNELSSMWGSNYASYYSKVRDAVMSTSGMYLTYGGNYIEALYHSTSNGRTEEASNVWGNYYPYLVSVDSSYDNSNPSFSISKSFSYAELSNILGFSVSGVSEFNILGHTSGGRVSVISVDGVEFSGVSFRSKLGLRSADFDIFKNDDGIVVTTRGYGHGVGMSQYGANGMAKAGSSYRDILFHYYSGVSIEQL